MNMICFPCTVCPSRYLPRFSPQSQFSPDSNNHDPPSGHSNSRRHERLKSLVKTNSIHLPTPRDGSPSSSIPSLSREQPTLPLLRRRDSEGVDFETYHGERVHFHRPTSTCLGQARGWITTGIDPGPDESTRVLSRASGGRAVSCSRRTETLRPEIRLPLYPPSSRRPSAYRPPTPHQTPCAGSHVRIRSVRV